MRTVHVNSLRAMAVYEYDSGVNQYIQTHLRAYGRQAAPLDRDRQADVRAKNGNRDDPAVAPVGVARKAEEPGYTARHDQRANYLVWEAERRQLKHAEEPAP